MVEFELEEVRVYLRLAEEKLVVARDLARALNDRIAADYEAEFNATEDLARRSIADTEAFLAKAQEVVAEAVGSEGEKNGRESV